MPVISALKDRQGDPREFEANLGYRDFQASKDYREKQKPWPIDRMTEMRSMLPYESFHEVIWYTPQKDSGRYFRKLQAKKLGHPYSWKGSCRYRVYD